MFAASIFEDADYSIVEAGTADEAIIILDAGNEVSLMFTDINMPGSMDGLMLARTGSDRWPSVRLIVTSGIVKPTVGQIPAGGRFVSKPYTNADIATILSEGSR